MSGFKAKVAFKSLWKGGSGIKMLVMKAKVIMLVHLIGMLFSFNNLYTIN